MTTTGDTMAQGVALRLRALAATRWVDRSDAATREALLAGAGEAERLAHLWTGARDGLRAVGAALGAHATTDEGMADACIAALGGWVSEERELRARMRGAHDAETMRLRTEVERLTQELERLQGARASATPPLSGDLAALARREAGPVTRRQWRACARCGREHWLADGEAAPLHGWVDPWGAAKTCAAVTVGEGSEGR